MSIQLSLRKVLGHLQVLGCVLALFRGFQCLVIFQRWDFRLLELLGFRASQILNSKKIAVALDARMGEVYWAIYDQGKISKLRICNPHEVDNLDTNFIGVGTGWDAYGDMLSLCFWCD